MACGAEKADGSSSSWGVRFLLQLMEEEQSLWQVFFSIRLALQIQDESMSFGQHCCPSPLVAKGCLDSDASFLGR